MKYICSYCNIYVYDEEEEGDPKTKLDRGTKLDEIPDSWFCPVCGMPKEYLKEVREDVFSIKMDAYTETQSQTKDITTTAQLLEACLKESAENMRYVMVSPTEFVLDRTSDLPLDLVVQDKEKHLKRIMIHYSSISLR